MSWWGWVKHIRLFYQDFIWNLFISFIISEVVFNSYTEVVHESVYFQSLCVEVDDVNNYGSDISLNMKPPWLNLHQVYSK